MKNKIEAVCVLNENNIKGTVIFKEKLNNIVEITAKIKGLKEGLHGIHIHKYGDLRQGCKSTCAHYNPHNKNHGGPNDTDRHVGDLGNIEVNSKGEGKLVLEDKLVKLRGKYSVIGRSIVIHDKEDDLGKGKFKDSKTTGHAGNRLCCGVIGYSKNNSC